jgi:hypothetical protein
MIEFNAELFMLCAVYNVQDVSFGGGATVTEWQQGIILDPTRALLVWAVRQLIQPVTRQVFNEQKPPGNRFILNTSLVALAMLVYTC